jgi:Anti-sigma-K factor rskA
VTGPPEFRDLLGDDLPAEDRARLERVHELLIAAGPPPELPPSLAEAPDRASRPPSWLPRRRLGAAFSLAAAIALVAFLGGYATGYQRSDNFDAARSVVLGGTGPTRAVVRFGDRDANGNRSMLVSVEGLAHARDGNYYTLFMTKNGRPLVTCGTFNVRDKRPTTLRFTVAYELENFDGLQLAEYHHSDHKDYKLLSAKLT